VSLTTDQLIAAVTGGATFAAAVATFLTVREVAKQRKVATRPDLVSERQCGYVYSEQPASCLRHIWSKEKHEHPHVMQHSSYTVTLLNLGTGAAKRVRAEWTIDIPSMVESVNLLARDATVAVSVESVPGSSEIRILWPDKIVGHQLVTNQLRHDLGHLLPASLSANGLQITVPPAYLTLASLQIALGMAAGRTVGNAVAWLRVPPARLFVRYADVQGELYTKHLQLSLTLLSAGHEGTAHTAGQLPTFMQFMVSLDEA
jgi:hypothetical protein